MPPRNREVATAPKEDELVFVQVSDSLMMGGDADAKWVDDYYASVYRYMPGYKKPPHYMELPLWISAISGMAGDAYEQTVHIVSDVEASIQQLEDTPGTLLFSTIESNAPYTHEIVARLPHRRILMGGHVNPEDFADYPNVTFLDKPEDLTQFLPGLDTDATPDNHLFAGQGVIPRLTMSTGCLFGCEFCMVPRQVVPKDEDAIWRQVESFQPLDFDLVYLDDKTFGQAPNWKLLGQVRDRIRAFNPGFMGFIVQTTTNVAAGDGKKNGVSLEAFEEQGVKYVEIGVESVNPETFRAMRKPYTLGHLETAIHKARDIGMPIIPNFIFGHPLDSGRYSNFVAWTEENRDVIAAINVNFLSVLFGATQHRRQQHLPTAQHVTDLDQNAYRKTWLKENEILEMLQAVRAVYFTTTGEDFHPEAYAEVMTRVTPEAVVAGALKKARTHPLPPMLQPDTPSRAYWRYNHRNRGSRQ